MNIRVRPTAILSGILTIAFMFSVTVEPTLGQERKSLAKDEASNARQTATQTAALRAVSAEDQLRTAIGRCGKPCRMAHGGSISASGGTLDYNCNEDGDCACFGAKDCVAMTDVCKEGTMGCNKQGCVCEKDTGD